MCMMKKVFFTHFRVFLIVFDHVNACASMHCLVEIHNKGVKETTHPKVYFTNQDKQNLRGPQSVFFPTFKSRPQFLTTIIAVPQASPWACNRAHTLQKRKKKERAMRDKVKEGSTKSKGGLYKMHKILLSLKVSKEWHNIPFQP